MTNISDYNEDSENLARVLHKMEGWKIIPPALYPNIYSFQDLRGKRVGRLTFVGYLGKLRRNRPGRWLARCDCGKEVIRAAYVFKRGHDEEQMCMACHRAKSAEWKAAQGIEAGTAKTGTGLVHESPLAKPCAQKEQSA